jgi:hypothetical protein
VLRAEFLLARITARRMCVAAHLENVRRRTYVTSFVYPVTKLSRLNFSPLCRLPFSSPIFTVTIS